MNVITMDTKTTPTKKPSLNTQTQETEIEKREAIKSEARKLFAEGLIDGATFAEYLDRADAVYRRVVDPGQRHEQ